MATKKSYEGLADVLLDVANKTADALLKRNDGVLSEDDVSTFKCLFDMLKHSGFEVYRPEKVKSSDAMEKARKAAAQVGSLGLPPPPAQDFTSEDVF